MADAGDIPEPRRMRAASFALSALLVCAGLAVVLLVTWRTHMAGPGDQGVRTWVESTPKPKPAPPAHAAPPPAIPSTVSAPSDTASDAVLAQMLTCFGPERERHAECAPHWNDPRLAASGPPISPSEAQAPSRHALPLGVYTPNYWADLPADACGAGHGAEPTMVTVCMRFPDPPPPSKSPEELCEAGLIGPCHPPAFRPEDVVHQQHTD